MAFSDGQLSFGLRRSLVTVSLIVAACASRAAATGGPASAAVPAASPGTCAVTGTQSAWFEAPDVEGICLENAGNYIGAISVYERSIEKWGKEKMLAADPDRLLHLSVDLDKLGRKKEAGAWWRAVYDTSSKNAQDADPDLVDAVTLLLGKRYHAAMIEMDGQLRSYNGGWPMGPYADVEQQYAPAVEKAMHDAADERYGSAASGLEHVVRTLPQFQEAQFYLGVIEIAMDRSGRAALESSLLNPRSRTDYFHGPDAVQVEALRLLLRGSD